MSRWVNVRWVDVRVGYIIIDYTPFETTGQQKLLFIYLILFLPKIIENLRKFGYPTRWKILSLKSYVQYVKF